MIKWDPALRANQEFQSALVRMGFWVFGVIYVGSAAYTGYYRINSVYFFLLFGVYFLFFAGILISVLIRPKWTARQYLGLVLDITAVGLATLLTGDVSPFYLIYIWILIYASTRYGRGHLIFASILNLLTCTLTIVVLDAWWTHPYEVVFILLLLVVLPMYQYSLLRKLQQARREAEVANQAKGDFLAVMTHELRTPLTGVVGMTNLLQSTRLDAEQREYVDSIVSSAEVLQALIGDVLDLSKIEAKKLHLESVAFDLRGGMREVCAALETQALAKGLEVILRIDPRLPDRMIGDKLRIRQILFNLIGNAIKFTDRGEVRVHASLCPSDELMHRPHLLLEVLDTGIGIPADRLEEIFEGFRQADDSTTRRYGGTGLGTTIASDLTHLMGGRIGVDSQVGKGSRFWVRLPLQKETRPLVSEERQRQLEGLRAWVFENNATSRELIMEILRGAGMACEPVLDMDHLGCMTDRTQRLDLLIVADSPACQDLLALLDLFQRGLGAKVPYLLLTYSTRRAGQRMARGNCLSKPFLAEDLVSRVRQILGKERPQSDRQEEKEDRAQPVAVHGLRILVAEDNAVAGKVVRVLLEKQGYEVILVDDGEQALSRIRADPFALALVDVRMPKLDGIALTRAFRASEGQGARLPIIALTANASEEVKHQCLEAGMDDFLSKPVNPRDLSKMVERYTGQREGDGPSRS
ncbi:ATP-binding protein [Candidatus Thiosymbion oneisti]|uniref:ATP-binding protein n=1 Tax=Candidatus Thiosymbion oneisti TaxID=589554 RepID=UPI00105B97F8|nr:ATP-binding protein [Candidatus Thiosymbion oneisti]